MGVEAAVLMLRSLGRVAAGEAHQSPHSADDCLWRR